MVKIGLSFTTQEWYEIILTSLTILMVTTYVYVYLKSKKEYGDTYIPLIVTGRSLILAFFLMYFYNPLRSSFQYGRSLPFIAFSAGLSLLLLVDKFQVMNLVHFLLYGKVMPGNPKKVCKLEDA
jgi:uncharacterized membrane protein YjfL (UPF0719 family)